MGGSTCEYACFEFFTMNIWSVKSESFGEWFGEASEACGWNILEKHWSSATRPYYRYGDRKCNLENLILSPRSASWYGDVNDFSESEHSWLL